MTISEDYLVDKPYGLYLDDGRPVVTHSMIKTMRRCPKQADYKYAQRLKPKVPNTNLKRGVWMHYLLEEYHAGRDWKIKHKELTAEFNKLFEEEREYHGDMPGDCAKVMRGYVWHYANAADWKVLETEFTIETEFPDGTIYRGKIDALVEDRYGLWLVDHKSHKSLPDQTFRLLDAQSALYLWACLRNKLPVQGFIWNYVKWKAPTVPALLKDGSRLSKSKIDTDYPTYASAIKKYGLDPAPYQGVLDALKADRYEPGMAQTSSFFRRDVLEKSPAMLKRIASEAYHTAQRMNSYDFDGNRVERVPDRRCRWDCSFAELCATELFGGNPEFIRRRMFEIGDPNDYYQDKAGEPWRDNEEQA